MTDCANVLVISYLFPPVGGIGSPRGLAYARYLPENGCRTFILTPQRPSVPVYDTALLEMIPSHTKVIRAFNPELPFSFRDKLWKRFAPPHRSAGTAEATNGTPPKKSGLKKTARALIQHLMFPDVQRTWNPFAIAKASQLIQREKIDTVILNVSPFSQLQIGIALKRKYPKIKLIADFRDDWTGYYLFQFDSPSQQKIARAQDLERRAVQACDFVSTVTPEWVSAFRSRYPDEPAGKFILTPNGYDPALFQNFESRPRTDGKLTFIYMGTVHNNRIYSPALYLEALDSLPEEIRSRIETRFIGRITPDAEPLLDGRLSAIKKCGFLPKQEAIRQLEEADVLLVIATDPGSHAGKLFDYLATGKPILALSPPEGQIGQLLKQTGTGICADPWNKDAIRAALLSLYERFQRGDSLAQPNWEIIRAYSWPEILKQFVAQTRLTALAPQGAIL